jgi:integrase
MTCCAGSGSYTYLRCLGSGQIAAMFTIWSSTCVRRRTRSGCAGPRAGPRWDQRIRSPVSPIPWPFTRREPLIISSVLFGFYDHACAANLGPLVNPVPAQRTRGGGRPHAHHNPMQDFVIHRRANYRQKTPRPVWRGIPDEAATALFSALRSHRDRALVSFYLSSGVRASELLGLCHGDLDAGRYTITVTSKGSRAREVVPASVDSFVWLALYFAEQQPPMSPGGPVWWTRRSKPAPLNYHAMRAVLRRANDSLGTNWSLHDFRHTAAARLLADPAFTLVDVQTVLRHASVTTTQIYTQPRLEDLVGKVLEHYARPPVSGPTIEPSYDAAAVRELLGLPPS